MALTHLTVSEMSAMLHAIFDLRRSSTRCLLGASELLDAMYTLTEGNPFFIEELLKSLIATGDVSLTRKVAGSASP